MRPLFAPILTAMLMLPLAARADLPLTVEDMLTMQDRWRVELGAVYANSDKTGVHTGQSVSIQTGPAQFITLPTVAGESRTNTDTLVVTPGLRYGLSADTELYTRASWLNTSSRIQTPDGMRSESDSRFADWWGGFNRQLVKEGKTPALLGFAETAIAERSGDNTAHGKSWLLGLTAYRTLDPLVLAATVAYRVNLARPVGGQDQKPGNFLLINPSVNFAVNDQVTLSTGLQWRRQGADTIGGTAQGIVSTRTDLVLGMGFQWDQQTTVNFTGRVNASGNGNGAEIGLTVLFKLGDSPRH